MAETARSSPEYDYRAKHLDKGGDYDAALARDAFDAFISAREQALVYDLVRSLFPYGVPRYLDFACGTGRIARVVEPLAVRSWGVDVSETMLVEARSKCRRTTFLRRDLTREAAGIEPVQLVTAFRFFGNAQQQLRQEAIGAIRQVLSPGGVLMLDNHTNPWTLRRGLRRLMRRSDEELVGDLHYWKLRRLLVAAGFRIVATRGIGFWIARARFAEPRMLWSPAAAVLERAFSHLAGAGPFSPVHLVVARKGRAGATAARRARAVGLAP
ncbi:MAG TPA: class I SAM-dependent methyltransferase [Gemmatimonadales bacterium]|nr:class I SAM-dependent methyltransferase [Gemmatimonadales bacterium]